MNFWELLICMSCFALSSMPVRMFVEKSAIGLPVRMLIEKLTRQSKLSSDDDQAPLPSYVLAIPGVAGSLALFGYGLMQLPWWQPIVALIIAWLLEGVMRYLLAHSLKYLWTFGFVAAGIFLALHFVS